MISISKEANVNYLAKIVKIKNIRKHSNADRLQIVTADFQDVVVGMDAKEGDIYCFFPVESQINKDFLSFTNSFRHAELNKDKEKVGFFEDNARVRAMKLRGEKSMGYLVPITEIEKFMNFEGGELNDFVGDEFDTVVDIILLKKYIVPVRGGLGTSDRQGKKPRVSRLIENQVRLHVDTENLRKNAFKINPDDDITVTYKKHGTSGWVSNVLVKKNLGLLEKFLKLIGFKIEDTEYDYVYGSRKVVKNSDMIDKRYSAEKVHFYGYDLWGDIKEQLKEFIPKGFCIYYECVGFLKSGAPIQPCYDYGCREGENKVFVYRITSTNADGVAHDLSSKQVKEFCDRFGLNFVHVFYSGKAKDMYPELKENEHWQEDFVRNLERDYNDKDCFMCVNKVPEEGIVLKKETLFGFEAYKLKSFRFLQRETELLDKGEEDIESIN